MQHQKAAALEQFGFKNVLICSFQEAATCLGICHEKLEEWGKSIEDDFYSENATATERKLEQQVAALLQELAFLPKEVK